MGFALPHMVLEDTVASEHLLPLPAVMLNGRSYSCWTDYISTVPSPGWPPALPIEIHTYHQLLHHYRPTLGGKSH
jgi:hypothetical protein